MKDSYFNIERDNQIIDRGGFFCSACLVGKPRDDQSTDKRYCLSCYEFLLKEASLLSGSPTWKPVKRPSVRLSNANSEGENLKPLLLPLTNDDEVLIRIKSENTRALQNLARPPVLSLGGRPRKDVPVDSIKKLSVQGMGVRDISRKLKITPSMVSRVLAGKRC